jgi:tyrocidine synthetase-3
MLVKRFEENVEKSPQNIAVKEGKTIYTYDELNRCANRIAGLIETKTPQSKANQVVGLLLDHGVHMIAAILGVLKAGKIYVPLSVDYPVKRLAYMISHSGAGLILTRSCHEGTAGELAVNHNIDYLNLDDGNETTAFTREQNPQREIRGEAPAYIMYTSGSTGWPKGVLQTHENALYYIDHWIRRFTITSSDRMTLFSSFCHDGSVQDMFAALHSGAALYPMEIRRRDESIELDKFLLKEKISIWHSVPSLYSYFVNTLTGTGQFPHLRYILLGGEALREHEIRMFKKNFPGSILVNVYGQTESSVNSTWSVHPGDSSNKMTVGEPLDHTELIVIDEEGKEVEPFETGEIIVACPHLSPGYWKDDEATRKSFYSHPTYGQLYRTGDLGRLLLDGNIEFIGRKDNQVKIRGFRIELGEIENQLLTHEKIKEAAVKLMETTGGDKYLCGYVAGESIEDSDLRKYLSQRLPDYMIPTCFVRLERFPLTASGKIDRNVLPAPGRKSPGKDYTAPRDEIEKKLALLWSQVLGIDAGAVGINSSFFELGGHSLKAVVLINKIHKELKVLVPIAELFRQPFIKELSQYIKGSRNETSISLEKAEEKEYYPVSSAQKRLYYISRLNPGSMIYNMSVGVPIQGFIDKDRLENTFRHLIRRHEVFRTSFTLVNKDVVQRVHDRVDFEVEYYDLSKQCEQPQVIEVDHEEGDAVKKTPEARIIAKLMKPFDLDRAPLLRAGLIKREENQYILTVDMHGIITDGQSIQVLRKEFISFYREESLTPLLLQSRDYVQWQNSPTQQEEMRRQKSYWLKQFEGEIPRLNLPLDYKRPAAQNFDGDVVRFEMEEEGVQQLEALASSENATIYMVLMAVFYILLSKLSSQEDIIIGTAVIGRRHADLLKIAGMFSNTVAIRNYPNSEKTFLEFFKEVRESMLMAFDNQEYPFDDLVQQLKIPRAAGRIPLFDVMIAFQPDELELTEAPSATNRKPKIPGLETGQPYRGNRTAKFDWTFHCRKVDNKLFFKFDYRTRLFKRETMEKFVLYYNRILSRVTGNPRQKISDIRIILPGETKPAPKDFNHTDTGYPVVPGKSKTYTPPKNELEKQVAGVWQQVLNLENIGVEDNFFEIGGTSLDIAHVIRSLMDTFTRDIPVITMLRYPTIRSMAAFVAREHDDFSDKKQEIFKAIDKSRQRQRLKKRRR